MTPGRIALAVVTALAAGSCSAAGDGAEHVFNLPPQLLEISGLAAAGPQSVFTHDDEHAIIYEFSLTDGHILRAFALGNPTLEGDFEGIATSGGRVFLVTSDGLIYTAERGANGQRVPYHVYDSGIGPRCEIEGLSQAPAEGILLVLCKRQRNGNKGKRLDIYRWQVGMERADEEPWLSIPLEKLLDKDNRAEFRPSGVEWDPTKRRLIVVSGRNRLLLEFDQTGKLLERHRLKGGRHHQTEGIAIMPDGRLVLADEGAKNREGRITVYPAL